MKIYVSLVLTLGLLVRITSISSTPNGLYPDEISTGYDAYSMLLTGRDQYGNFLPLFARSFGDYNESLYRFMVIIPVYLTGLNELSVRIPAVLFGSLTILILYFLAKELIGKGPALYSTIFLAINPWHVHFSRIGFRATLFPFFFCLGYLFFLKGIKNFRCLLVSGLAFSVCLYTYASARIFVPLFILFLIITYFPRLWKFKIHFLIFQGIILAVIILLGKFWFTFPGMARGLSALDKNPIHWPVNYLSYYSPKFLFFEGDPIPRHSVNGMGQLYMVEIITLILGFYTIARKWKFHYLGLVAWLIMYPVPAMFTAPSHALRAIIGAPLFCTLSGLGLNHLVSSGGVKIKRLIRPVTAVILVTSFALYLENYFIEYPKYSASSWQYGIREAIKFVEKDPTGEVFISARFLAPYVYVLFYTRYPPARYQQSPVWNFQETKNKNGVKLGRYRILPLEYIGQFKNNKAYIIASPGDIPYLHKQFELEKIRSIKNPSGQNAVIIFVSKLRDISPSEHL